MQLHVDPPGDMTEGSLAGLRDKLELHLFVRCSVRFLDGVCSSTSCHSEKKKRKKPEQPTLVGPDGGGQPHAQELPLGRERSHEHQPHQEGPCEKGIQVANTLWWPTLDCLLRSAVKSRTAQRGATGANKWGQAAPCTTRTHTADAAKSIAICLPRRLPISLEGATCTYLMYYSFTCWLQSFPVKKN